MKKLVFVAILTVMAIGVKAQHKIESPHPDLKFELRRAVESGGSVVIDMIVTNLGKDEEVQFAVGNLTKSVIYDDEGNEYKKNISIGNPGKALRQYPEMLLPRDVPVKVRIQVDEVDEYATSFPMMQIEIRSHGAMRLFEKKPLTIRNVEFVKQ